jgi:hypothetical protein
MFSYVQLCSVQSLVSQAWHGTLKLSGVTRNFFRGGGVQQIQLKTERRVNGDLGAVAPQSGVPLNLQMSETVL